MLTHDTLKQYQDLKCEIKELQARLDKMANPTVEHDAVSGSMLEIPYKMHTIHIFGVDHEKYRDKREKLQRLIHRTVGKYEELTLEVSEGITAIEDSRVRRIVSMRYLDGMSWAAISRKLGSHDESYARKIHDRYFQNI
ncbi:MAG: hypothetical protein K0M69_15810 [Youngiibacter sp.]|nr:hypothetical protein [Youngiibacter sp.]